MSRQAIPAIPADMLDLAASAILGVEKRVFYTLTEVAAVGTVEQSAPDAGTLKADPTFPAAGPYNAGFDLQVALTASVRSSQSIVLTFGVTFADMTTGSATATFAAPTWVADQTFDFPIGLAVDLKGTAGNSAKQILSVDSLTSIAGGSTGGRYAIIGCPDADDYTELPCVKDLNPMPPSNESISIPCGYNSSRWVKKGRQQNPTISITSADPGAIGGVNRLNGQRVTLKVEIVKDERLLTQRAIYGGFRPKITPKLPDGNGEADVTAEGPYETPLYAIFC